MVLCMKGHIQVKIQTYEGLSQRLIGHGLYSQPFYVYPKTVYGECIVLSIGKCISGNAVVQSFELFI